MNQIQETMGEKKIEDHLGKISSLPPMIKPKFCSTKNCVIPVYVSCQLSIVDKQSFGVVKKIVNRGLVIFYLSIRLTSELLVDCLVDMDKRSPIVVFVEVRSIIMPRLELFGLKTKCLLEMVKPSWEI